MSIRLVTDKENVDYQAVADILDHFGLSHFDAATEEKIFKNSYATAFIYDGDQVVGCARAISDGVCQAAIYNVALLEEGYRFGDNDYERQPYVSPRSIRQEQEKQNQTVQEREKIMRENTSTEWVNKEVDSESDVRLYVTLVRFDCAYYPVFRLNKKLLRDYPNLWAYARDLYQTPGFGDTTNFAAIKKHYHIDCCPSNEFAIVPNGPDETLWMTPHRREKLSGK